MATSRRPVRPIPGQSRPAKRAAAKTPAQGTGLNLPLVFFGLLLISGIAFVALRDTDKPDEHYLAAVSMVDEYEFGVAEELRDYRNPAYSSALGELAQVDPESISIEAARALEAKIRGHIAAYTAKREQKNAADEAIQKRRQQRVDTLLAAQQRDTGTAFNAAERVTLAGASPACVGPDGEVHYHDDGTTHANQDASEDR